MRTSSCTLLGHVAPFSPPSDLGQSFPGLLIRACCLPSEFAIPRDFPTSLPCPVPVVSPAAGAHRGGGRSSRPRGLGSPRRPTTVLALSTGFSAAAVGAPVYERTRHTSCAHDLFDGMLHHAAVECLAHLPTLAEPRLRSLLVLLWEGGLSTRAAQGEPMARFARHAAR